MRSAAPLGAVAGLTGLVLLAHPAAAQYGSLGQPYSGGILPNVGTDTRIGDLRPQLQSYFQSVAGPPSTTPAWLIQPSIGVDVALTDNALRTNSPRRGDVYTIISPSLVLTGDTARLKVNMAYSPQVTVYASNSSQNQVNQFFNGQALATIVPDAVFFDLRGSIGLTSLTSNGVNNGSTQSFNRQNSVQTITVSATPYAEHRFGGWGTARVGYSVVRSLQDRQDNQQFAVVNDPSLSAFGTPGFGTTGNLTTQRERASFASGENLGRWNDLLIVEAIQYNGSGSYRGAFRNQFSNEVGYALTRKITLLGGFGYQDLRFAGVPPVRVREPTWNFGARYAPNPDSTLTVLYGRRDAITSISFDGQFAPTARTRIIGRYSTGLTTDIEDAQNVLSTTTVGPTGLLTDTATGAPVGSGGSTFGTQNGIYKVKRLSVTALLLQDRNSYSVGVSSEDRTTATTTPTLFNNGVIPAGTNSTNISANASWQHDLAPDMSSTVSAQYSMSNNAQQYLGAGGSQQRTLSLTGALSKQFTETLSGSVRYTFTDQSGGQAGTLQFGQTASGNAGLFLNRGSYTENLLLVGLRKSF